MKKYGKSSAQNRAEVKARGDNSITLLAVGNRYDWECQKCGRPTPKELMGIKTFQSPVVDHIIPLSKGGTHSWDNVRLLCNACNSKKGNKMPTY